MTYFQSYLLTTLLPNIGSAIGFFSVITSLVFLIMVVGFMKNLDDAWREEEKDKIRSKWVKLPIKKTILAFVSLVMMNALLPDTKQVATIIGLSAVTGPDAKIIYGEAGDYLRAFLKQQTEELTKEKKD